MKVWGVKAARAVPPLIGGAFKSKDRGTFWNRRSSAGVVVQSNNYTVTKDLLYVIEQCVVSDRRGRE